MMMMIDDDDDDDDDVNENDDSLKRKILKHNARSKDIITFPFFLNKQRNDFLEIHQESQRKQIWTKEDSCASPLLRYLCYVMLCSFLSCKNDTTANIHVYSSDQQFISFNICTYHLYNFYTICFHVVPLHLT